MISSRTPEGSPNDCPVCGQRLRIEPSLDSLDAPCPHCGHLLWFGREEELSPELREERARARAEKKRDSLKTVDLVLQLEEDWRAKSS